jgi:hypothetical protein
VKRAYFTYPVTDGLLEAGTIFHVKLPAMSWSWWSTTRSFRATRRADFASQPLPHSGISAPTGRSDLRLGESVLFHLLRHLIENVRALVSQRRRQNSAFCLGRWLGGYSLPAPGRGSRG